MSDGMTPHYHRVKEFMLRAKQECPLTPTVPDEQVRRLRAALIMEEALETVKALGFDAFAQAWDKALVPLDRGIVFEANHNPDLIEIIDGVCDLSVVSIGTLVACGVRDEKVLEIVDRNNLEKFGPGHSWRDDGKLVKPPGHLKPIFRTEHL